MEQLVKRAQNGDEQALVQLRCSRFGSVELDEANAVTLPLS